MKLHSFMLGTFFVYTLALSNVTTMKSLGIFSRNLNIYFELELVMFGSSNISLLFIETKKMLFLLYSHKWKLTNHDAQNEF